MSNNIVLGNGSASLNGTGVDNVGGGGIVTGDATVTNNFVNGDTSGTGNGTSTDGNGKAVVSDNLIWGDLSGSFSGVSTSGNADATGPITSGSVRAPAVETARPADLSPSKTTTSSEMDPASSIRATSPATPIFGDVSGSANGDSFADNTIFGNYSGSGNGANFTDNTILGNGSGNLGGANVSNTNVIGDVSGNGYGASFNNVVGSFSGNAVDGSFNNVVGNGSGNFVTGSSTSAQGNLSGNGVTGDGNSASGIGFSAMGVVGRNLLGSGERLAISGAVGFSVQENNFGRQGSNSSVGGRAGAQVTW